ncbi:MAG: hypothetical protein JW908_06595 [Anaerolineales bacterium]|nr:hypothetical protein [Anaerolineales bacterium]
MAEYMQQLENLLLNPPGNLIYQLVLVFSIAGVLPSILSQSTNSYYVQAKRMGIGLSLLLCIRLVLFLAAIIARKIAIDEHFIIPPIERAVSLLGLVVIIWLWCFPKPLRTADIFTIIAGGIITITSIVSVIWWFYQGTIDISFNSFPASSISDVIALFLLAIGVVTIVVRRPVGWGFGLVMFVFLGAGHTASLSSGSLNSDYSGILRFMQMIAYPLLFTLPQRFVSEISSAPAILHALEEHRQYGVNDRLLKSFLTLSVENDFEKLYQAMSLTVSHAMVADLCFLAFPVAEKEEIVFNHGYDLIREEYSPSMTIKMRKLPALVNAYQQNEPLSIHASSNSPDLTSLARALSLANAGHLLSAPIGNASGNGICLAVLLTPYSGHEWSDEDRSTLSLICDSLAQILQRHRLMASFRQEIEDLQQDIQTSRLERDAAQLEIDRLSEQIKSFREYADQESREFAKSEAEHEPISSDIPQEETQPLETITPQEPVENSKMQEILATGETEGINKKLEGEWFLALEEIDRLNKIILEMEQTQREYASLTSSQFASGSKSEMYANLIKELNSPLSSITGYTDFLLAESFGNLGPIQRKFVERIKFSCDRINSILEVTPDSNITLAEKLQLNPESLDLQDIIDSAIERTRFEMLEKRITLDRTRSQYLPTVYADQDALEQVLISLLENAIAVTPEEGKISLRTLKKPINGGVPKVLIQVTDQGGSSAAKTTYQVFISQSDSAFFNISQEGIDMAMVKDLVEMQNGSIWIESEEGFGSTVNLVMPISSPQSSDTDHETTETNSEEEIQPDADGGIEE